MLITQNASRSGVSAFFKQIPSCISFPKIKFRIQTNKYTKSLKIYLHWIEITKRIINRTFREWQVSSRMFYDAAKSVFLRLNKSCSFTFRFRVNWILVKLVILCFGDSLETNPAEWCQCSIKTSVTWLIFLFFVRPISNIHPSTSKFHKLKLNYFISVFLSHQFCVFFFNSL